MLQNPQSDAKTSLASSHLACYLPGPFLFLLIKKKLIYSNRKFLYDNSFMKEKLGKQISLLQMTLLNMHL